MPIVENKKNIRPLAAFANEKNRRPTDNLALDAMDAERAGMSYGQYKVAHLRTKEANEPRLAAKQKSSTTMAYVVECAACGKKFTTTDARRRYCGAECQQKKSKADYHARYAKRKAGGENV